MSWGDLITVACVLLALWTFIPRSVRAALRSGLWPAVAALLDVLHDGAIVLRKVITVLAYRGLLGVPVPTSVIVKPDAVSVDNEPAVEPAVTAPTAALSPIAINSSEYSDELSGIRFEERARVVADLYRSGAATNLSKTICQVFHCSVQSSSKPESTYQRALQEVNKHIPQGAQFRQPDGSTAPASRPVTS